MFTAQKNFISQITHKIKCIYRKQDHIIIKLVKYY